MINKIVYIEKGLNRLITKILSHDCGTITAFRSNYSLEENKKRNHSLLAKLYSLGYSITEVKGGYIENFGDDNAKEVQENVFFVCDEKDSGNLKNNLLKFGEEFEQDSILFIPKANKESMKSGEVKSFLIGTNNASFPGYHKEIEFPILKIGKGDNQFLTRVNGRPFFFTDNVLTEHRASGIGGMMAANTVAKKNWKDIEVD